MKRRSKHLALAAGLLGFAVLGADIPASATGVAAGATARVSQIGPVPPLCLQGNDIFNPGSVGAACAAAQYDLVAGASADFGMLGASSRVDLVSVTSDLGFIADANASFSDTLTISAGSQVVFTFGLAGTGMPAIFGKIGDMAHQVIPPGETISLTYGGITPGRPFNIGFHLDTNIDFGTPNCTFDNPCDVHFLSDWGNTAILESVDVLDNLGNALSGVVISSESGFGYTGLHPGPQPVPGVPTLVFVGLGAALAALCRLRGIQ